MQVGTHDHPNTSIKTFWLNASTNYIIPSNFSKSKSGTNHTFQLIMTIPTMNFINEYNHFFDDAAFLHLISKQEEEAIKK